MRGSERQFPLSVEGLTRGRLDSRWLVGATVVFLTAPVALFLVGWLRAVVAWPAIGLLVASSWIAARRLLRSEGGDARSDAGTRGSPQPRDLARWALFLVGAGLVVLVVSISGAGGSGVETWDWEKHNAVLADLVEQPWPVAYRVGDQNLALVYYLAYYLPAAAAGRAAGWLAANVVLFLWTAVGAVLAWQWIARLGRASPWIALLVIALWSGFDLLGAAFPSQRLLADALPWWRQFDLEWWHGTFVYPGNITLLAYAPGQALGGWLATALALEALRRGIRGFPLAWPLTVCLLWSPFAACGLAGLLVLFELAAGVRGLGSLARRQLSFSTLAILGGVALPLLLYYAARVPTPDLPPDLQPPIEAREVARLAFLPITLGVARFTREWARFLGVELLPVVAALAGAAWLARRRGRGADRFGHRLLIAATALLAVVPCIGYGYYDDWVMRASIPPLFALQVLMARTLSRAAVPIAARRAVAALVLVAGLYPLAQLWWQATAIGARDDWIRVPHRDEVRDVFELQRGPNRYYGFAEQYLGGTGTPFFRLLARAVTARRIAAPSTVVAPMESPRARSS